MLGGGGSNDDVDDDDGDDDNDDGDNDDDGSEGGGGGRNNAVHGKCFRKKQSNCQSCLFYLNEKVFTRQGDNYFTDQKTLPVTVSARYIRFHPMTQEYWNTLRVEVYEGEFSANS